MSKAQRTALTTATVLALAVALGCGGKQKTTGLGASGAIAGGGAVDDLKIPEVDPKLCDAKGKQVVTGDLNRDNKPELWKLYKEQDEKGTTVQILTCKQVDLDHDGRKDYVAHYDDSGAITAEEYDFDFDGKFDARFHYDKKTGKRYLVEREAGFDAKPDIWEKYDGEEKLESLRRDRNGDGKPDYWEQYRSGALDLILYDDDFDGKVDRQEHAGPKAPPPVSASASDAAGEGAAPATPPEDAADETKPADGAAAAETPPAEPGKPAPKTSSKKSKNSKE